MDYSDNGYKSRKMVMSYIVIALIFIGFLATGKWTDLSAAYGTLIMGLLAASSIFTGANTALQWMAHQANLKDKEIGIEPEEPEDPEPTPKPPVTKP